MGHGMTMMMMMMMAAGPREKAEVIRENETCKLAGDRHSHLAMAIHHRP
jgi:hypothetical protein